MVEEKKLKRMLEYDTNINDIILDVGVLVMLKSETAYKLDNKYLKTNKY